MTNGFSVTATMTLDDHAQQLVNAGFSALVYDPPFIGASSGQPRGAIDIWSQLHSYRDAITFALSNQVVKPFIDTNKLVVYGISFSGLVAQFVAAFDNRVAGLIVHAPVCGSKIENLDIDQTQFDKLRKFWDSIDVSSLALRAIPMCVVEQNQQQQAQVALPFDTAREYFNKYGNRPSANWNNQVQLILRKSDPLLSFHRAPARSVKVPTLFVVASNDEVPDSNPSVSKYCFDLVQSKKQIVELPCAHFDLFTTDSPFYCQAVRADIDFINSL